MVNGIILTCNLLERNENSKCVRKTVISGETVMAWVDNKSKPTNGISQFIWKNMSKTQRLRAVVETFNEGHGVNCEIL